MMKREEAHPQTGGKKKAETGDGWGCRIFLRPSNSSVIESVRPTQSYGTGCSQCSLSFLCLMEEGNLSASHLLLSEQELCMIKGPAWV